MSAHTVRTEDHAVRTSIRFLEELTAGYRKENFCVRLWDGTEWGDRRWPRFTLVIKHPGALRKMFGRLSELSLADAFVSEDFDIEGDIEGALGLSDFLLLRDHSIIEELRLGDWLAALPVAETQDSSRQDTLLHGPLRSKDRDRIPAGYDVPNEFYALWLDHSMVDSCAYFDSNRVDLGKAQEHNLRYVCKKLGIREGDRVLNLGCGWGGLMVHIAKSYYGIRVHGTTRSLSQAEFARDRFRFAGVTDRCMIDICDYCDLDPPQQFDKIVSGMFEQVQDQSLREYFRRVWEMLQPGGLFLKYCLAASTTFRKTGLSFTDRYAFPVGELGPLNAAIFAAELAGFEVRDVESLREHCALTLRHWQRRLEADAEEAKRIVGNRLYRVWRLYLSGAAHRLTSCQLNLYQLLLSKPDHGKSRMPLTREEWYV